MDYIRLFAEALKDDDKDVHPDGSKLTNEVALDVLKIVRDELQNLGCRLEDWYISFTVNGFDITKVKIACDNPKAVMDALKEAEPEVRHEFSHSPTKYAYMAANVEIARRIQDELGLDYEAMSFEDVDTIHVSVSEPKEEKPLPPSEIPAPDAIAAGMPDEADGELDLGPGAEDVAAATGGGGGGGGGLGGLGGGLGAPLGGGEEDLEGGKLPGGIEDEEPKGAKGPKKGAAGEEGPEGPGGDEEGEEMALGDEEGAPEDEEGAPEDEEPLEKRPGMEF